jgi:hypothetical protein
MNNIKQKKQEYPDDGRVIADMSLDGIPRPFYDRLKRRNVADTHRKKEIRQEQIHMTPAERRSVVLGILTSYVLFGLIVLGAFALLIYFMIRFWLR